jgi:hypothetical protein
MSRKKNRAAQALARLAQAKLSPEERFERAAHMRAVKLRPPSGRKDWLDVHQLIAMLGATPALWRKAVSQGRLRGVFKGRKLWVDPQAAERFVQEWHARPRGRGRPAKFKGKRVSPG